MVSVFTAGAAFACAIIGLMFYRQSRDRDLLRMAALALLGCIGALLSTVYPLVNLASWPLVAVLLVMIYRQRRRRHT